MKPTVHYKPHADDYIALGRPAYIVCPLDHPSSLVSNTQPVHTSWVVGVGPEAGVFETRNTIYKPKTETP